MSEWKWTDKLPLLIAGLTALAAGFFLLSRKTKYGISAGLVLIVVGGLVTYHSTTIKKWCAPKDAMSFQAHAWGAGFKFHKPSLYDCFVLTR